MIISFNYNNATIQQLKQFADQHGINPVGDRRTLKAWRDAVAEFVEASKPVAEDAAFAVAGVATAVYEIAASEQAKAVYIRCLDAAVAGFINLCLWVFDAGVASREIYEWATNGSFDAAIEHYYDNTERVESQVSQWVQWKAYAVGCTVSQFVEDSLMQWGGWAEKELSAVNVALLLPLA